MIEPIQAKLPGEVVEDDPGLQDLGQEKGIALDCSLDEQMQGKEQPQDISALVRWPNNPDKDYE